MAGGELDAERREDAVEAAVLERQVLGVALDPVDLDAGRGGALAAAVEQLRGEVERRDAGAERAARSAALPVPAAMSSTSMPGSMATRSMRWRGGTSSIMRSATAA